MMEMTKKRITMMKTTITAQGASLRAISADVVRELQNQIESATLHSSDATNFDLYFAMDNGGNNDKYKI